MTENLTTPSRIHTIMVVTLFTTVKEKIVKAHGKELDATMNSSFCTKFYKSASQEFQYLAYLLNKQ